MRLGLGFDGLDGHLQHEGVLGGLLHDLSGPQHESPIVGVHLGYGDGLGHLGLGVRGLVHSDYVEVHDGADGVNGEQEALHLGGILVAQHPLESAILVGLELLVHASGSLAHAADLHSDEVPGREGHLLALTEEGDGAGGGTGVSPLALLAAEVRVGLAGDALSEHIQDVDEAKVLEVVGG